MPIDTLPLIVGWELTLACNLRCDHCGSAAGSTRRRELSTREALAICEQLPALLVQQVDFTGGEVLVRPDWAVIAERLARLGIRTQLITNGVLLTPQTAARMAAAGLSSIGFSLDGLEFTHDSIRQYAGLFRQVMRAIEWVQKAGMDVSVLTTINGRNIDELPALLGLLRTAGVAHWQIQPLFPLGRAKDRAELGLSPDLFMQIGEFLRTWGAQAEREGFSIDLADSLGYGTACDPRPGVWRGCPGGIVGCGITSDGKIKGCLSMPDDLVQGDLRERELWDIWFAPDAFAFNRQFGLEDLGPACRGCERGALCKGGCSSMSYGSTGQLHNDPYCFQGITLRKEQALAGG